MRRRQIWVCMSSGMGLLVSIALLSVALWPTQHHALAAARERWQAQPFDRYRLVVEHRALLSRCHQEIEIAGEQIVAVAANSCPYPATTTVAELFATAERYVSQHSCGPNSCACDGSMAVDVVYDQQLGYPQELIVRAQPAQRWQHVDYWRNLWHNGGRLHCAVVGYTGPRIRVLELTPLSAAARP